MDESNQARFDGEVWVWISKGNTIISFVLENLNHQHTDGNFETNDFSFENYSSLKVLFETLSCTKSNQQQGKSMNMKIEMSQKEKPLLRILFYQGSNARNKKLVCNNFNFAIKTFGNKSKLSLWRNKNMTKDTKDYITIFRIQWTTSSFIPGAKSKIF